MNADFYRALLDHSAEAVLVLDPSGKASYANPATVRVFGLAPQDVVGRVVTGWVQTEHGPALGDLLQRCIQQPGQVVLVAGTFHHPGEGDLYVYGEGRLINLRDNPAVGGVLFYFQELGAGLVRGAELEAVAADAELPPPLPAPSPGPVPVVDVPGSPGPRDLAQEPDHTLLARTSQVRRLLDVFPEQIYAKNAQFRFVAANAAACQARGAKTLEELLGRTEAETLPEELARQLDAIDRKVLESGKAVLNQEVHFRHEGASHWLLVTAVPDKDPDGRVVALLVLSIDITERKGLEEAQQRAKEAAEAANQAKSQFLAKMSHEIRTPLNGIMALTEVVLSRSLDDEQRESLETALASADVLRIVLNDILDFSKIEAGKLELERAPFSLRDTLNKTFQSQGPRAQQKGLRLSWRVDGEVPDALVGDSVRLRQVLFNLIGNAIKFTERGEVVVTVEVSPHPPTPSPTKGGEGEQERRPSPPSPPVVGEGGRGGEGGAVTLRFEVRDTGPGIPASLQATIFEPFRQADSSTSRKYGGTGLGLAIASELVAMMGGRLRVQSEPGQGSTFAFTASFEVSPSALAPASLVSASLQAQSVRPLNVLLVEDNPTNQKVVSRALERWGHRLTVASSARAALALLGVPLPGPPEPVETFDVVLMDVEMPGMDGREATTLLRRHEGPARDVPVVGLTAHAIDGYRERCLAAGMDDYVSKPIHFDTLFAALERAAQGRMKDEGGRMKEEAVRDTSASSLILHPSSFGGGGVFDEQRALAYSGNDRRSLAQRVGLFVKAAPGSLERMRGLVQEGKLDELRLAAHNLKGVGGALSGKVLETAARLEQAAKEGKAPEAQQAWEALAGQVGQLLAELRAWQPS